MSKTGESNSTGRTAFEEYKKQSKTPQYSEREIDALIREINDVGREIVGNLSVAGYIRRLKEDLVMECDEVDYQSNQAASSKAAAIIYAENNKVLARHNIELEERILELEKKKVESDEKLKSREEEIVELKLINKDSVEDDRERVKDFGGLIRYNKGVIRRDEQLNLGSNKILSAGFAIYIGNIERVKYLVSQDCEIIDDSGNSIWHYAVAGGLKKSVEYLTGDENLLQHIDKKNNLGLTALDMSRLLKLDELEDILLKSGAGLEGRGNKYADGKPSGSVLEAISSKAETKKVVGRGS